MQLIELQDTKLSEIQEKAAAIGVNITLEVRKIYTGVDDPYGEDPSPNATKTRIQYAA